MAEDIEVAGAEFGLEQTSSKTDKYLGDGSIMLHKTSKDMLHALVKRRPDLIHELKVIRFVVMGKNM